MPAPRKAQTPEWILETEKGVVAKLLIQPKASRSEISGIHGEVGAIRLKVRIAAPPVEGAANEELIRFLRKQTRIPTSRIHIVRGDSSRNKDVFLEGASVDDIVSLLRESPGAD